MKRKLSTGELVCYGCKADKLTGCARGDDGTFSGGIAKAVRTTLNTIGAEIK
jgi:hypothetical protein